MDTPVDYSERKIKNGGGGSVSSTARREKRVRHRLGTRSKRKKGPVRYYTTDGASALMLTCPHVVGLYVVWGFEEFDNICNFF